MNTAAPAWLKFAARPVSPTPEETTKVTAELGGYEGKAYEVTDRETGERKSLVPVNLFSTS